MYLAIYVDDILIFGPNNEMLDDIQKTLNLAFECTDLGTAHYILGIQINISKKGISLNQEAYIDKILV